MRRYRSNRLQIGCILDKENNQNIEKEAHDEPMKHTCYVTTKEYAQNI